MLIRAERQIANRGNQTINTKRNYTKEKVCKRSRSKACRLQRGMIDNYAANPPQEKSQQETNKVIIVIHNDTSKINL